jgi:hypothetical protein
MPTEVPTQEEFQKVVDALEAMTGTFDIPENVQPAVKAVLEWLASKLNGSITWS